MMDIQFHKDGRIHIVDWEVMVGFDMDGQPEILSGDATPEEAEQALIEYNRYYSPVYK